MYNEFTLIFGNDSATGKEAETITNVKELDVEKGNNSLDEIDSSKSNTMT